MGPIGGLFGVIVFQMSHQLPGALENLFALRSPRQWLLVLPMPLASRQTSIGRRRSWNLFRLGIALAGKLTLDARIRNLGILQQATFCTIAALRVCRQTSSDVVPR